MGEEWKPIKGYEGLYAVSDLGRVRRELTRTNGKAGHILKQQSDKDGYATVPLSKPGARARNLRVNRLVCDAFTIGGLPVEQIANHLDGDPTNNRASNLEPATHQQNVLHAFRVLGRARTGEKLTAEQARSMRERRAAGDSLSVLADAYSVSTATVASVVQGKTWRAAGGPITPVRPMKQTPQQVGARLSDEAVRAYVERYHHGESTQQLADEAGVDKRSVYNWIEGRCRSVKPAA